MITVILSNVELTDIKKHPTNQKLFTALAKAHKRYQFGDEVKEVYQSMTVRFLEFHGQQLNREDRHTITGELLYDKGLKAQVVNVTSITRELIS